ncbi:hypothetical protein BX666DRAFT_1967424 [Dichotomocladium elegans]|nr:hypothetical protein BX666DRAFT_1967424 [Dichotomocladium elegans]
MPGSFIIVRNTGKKFSLEHGSHACPRCKDQASVQLTRSEKQIILLNKCITSSTRVRYECSKCNWKNAELPEGDTMIEEVQQYLAKTPEHEQFTFYFSTSPPSTSPLSMQSPASAY